MKPIIVKLLIILVLVCKLSATKEVVRRNTETNVTAVTESSINKANKKVRLQCVLPLLITFDISFISRFRLSQLQLHVAIYYESLCPDSIRFITNQLDPTYGYFKDYIEVELIPFGKSEVRIYAYYFGTILIRR